MADGDAPLAPLSSSQTDRRRALRLLAGTGLLALAGCAANDAKTASGAAATAPGRDTAAVGTSSTTTRSATTATPSSVTGSCVLQPETTQGPFWLTDHPETANLVRDRPGTPLELTLTVVDERCSPLRDAKVDIWHCDAAGTYAGVDAGGPTPPGGARGARPAALQQPPPGAGGVGDTSAAATRANPSNWLQGYQRTGADGVVRFTTIYPGWYPGRAVHIHLKVFVGGADVHTGQLFFPDEVNDEVFRSSAYRGTADTPNAADSIFRSAGSAAVITPAKSASGYAAAAQLVVTS